MSGSPSATVLGLDTTTSVTTAAIIGGGRNLAERTALLRRGDHARALPAMIEEVLAEAGVSATDLEAVAVAVGPGSFTGIRLGIGFAKGFAFARGIPLVGVGTLDALAEIAGGREKPLAVCLDARKGEVYLAVYAPASAGAARRRSGEIEALAPVDASRRIAEQLSDGGVVVGDAAETYPADFGGLAEAGIELVSFASVHPHGGAVATIGERLLALGKARIPEAVAAVYVRPSAAEMSRGVALTTPPGRS